MARLDARQRRRRHLARQRIAAAHATGEDGDGPRGVGGHREVRGRRGHAHQLARVTQSHFHERSGRLVAGISIEHARGAPKRRRGGAGLAPRRGRRRRRRKAHAGHALERLGLKARRARGETWKSQPGQIARRNRLEPTSRDRMQQPAGGFGSRLDGRRVAAQVCADQQQRGGL
jgi:hypothetical protein